MKTTILFTTLIIFMLFCGQTRAQQTLSVDPDREILVLFKEDIVNVPSNVVAGELSRFNISSSGLQNSLQQANVEFMGRLVPDFKPTDRTIKNEEGQTIKLSDWTNTFLLRIPDSSSREAFIDALNKRPEVVYAEPNGRGEHDALEVFENSEHAISDNYPMAALIPNDQHFDRQWALQNDGTGLQGNGTPGADIRATDAWDITTGSSSVSIAIVDNGMQTGHADFTGRVSGDGADNSAHGTGVAGVAASQGNNTNGIAGVAWNVGIINEDYGGASDADFSNAVLSASNRGARAINSSWRLTPTGRWSATVRRAYADVYKQNRVAVASMGNQALTPESEQQYPAAFGQGILTVGASTNTDQRADYSSRGNWIDVVAPGGGRAPGGVETIEDRIFLTTPGNGYGYNLGTSFAAPAVTGLAGLLLSYDSSLDNDDVEQIIRLSADEVPGMGGQDFTDEYGTGRVNAHQALQLLQSPYTLQHITASGGSDYSSTGTYTATFYGVSGLADGNYQVKRHEVRRSVSYSYMNGVNVWGRGVATTGFSAANPNFGMGWCEPVSVSETGATLRTFVYEVWTTAGQWIGWYPASPPNTTFAYTIHGIPSASPPSVSISGPNSIDEGQQGTWTANASGGVTPYSYTWHRDGSYVSSSQTYSYTSYNPGQTFTLKATVTDANSSVASTTKQVYVTFSGGLPEANQDSLITALESPKITEFSILPNYPNPFNPSTTIRFALPEEATVNLAVYNILGHKVATLVNESRSAGFYTVNFDGKGLASGLYIARLNATGQSGRQFVKEMKMQMIK